jgi:hypothetical protein
MTLTISRENIYFSICLILLITQVWQLIRVDRTKKEVNQIWDQISLLVMTVGATIQKIESRLDENEKSK